MDKVEKVARAKELLADIVNLPYELHAPLLRFMESAHPETLAQLRAALAVMEREGEAASYSLNTSAVVSHEAANVSDKTATRKEALQVDDIREAILENCWGESNGDVNGSYDAAKAIASLYASPRPEAVGDGGWQPIATAPRDGTTVLLFVPNGVRRHYVCPESAKQFAVGMCTSPNPTYGGPDQWVSVECEDMGSMGGEYTGWMPDWEMTPVEPSHWKPLSAPIDIAAAIRSGT